MRGSRKQLFRFFCASFDLLTRGRSSPAFEGKLSITLLTYHRKSRQRRRDKHSPQLCLSTATKMKPFALSILLSVVLLYCVRDSFAFAPNSATNQLKVAAATPSDTPLVKKLPSSSPSSTTPSCTILSSKKFSEDSDYRNSVYGVNVERGPVLLGIVMLYCVWQFTIPVEFRRARFCSEEQVIAFPDSKCITIDNWAKGIQEYYQNGGGIQWDFSLEENE